jgi:[citrate (pro-3S)-lyase] ligase
LKLVPHLYVLVVQESCTVIPFEDRIKLIREGIQDLENIDIIPSSEFVLSNATLPEYFNKEKSQVVNVDASRDIDLFMNHVMPALNVSIRIVGTEPYCKVTKEYNRQIAIRFEEKGLKFIQIERIKVNNNYVSASKVRKSVLEGNLEQIRDYVPKTTYEYLVKNQEKVIQRIKEMEMN